ncbi:hypothetical protein V5O48_018573 [Marasmius crinis-equi]|uniref:Uncharacterized protein n=1 Tax=Marasmius crinis-equi TaxID=585013 RepID=A0ABR3EKT8_9AGAR
MAASWSMNDILREAQNINIVYPIFSNATCTPKIHDAPRGSRKMATYRVIIERFPGGEGKEHQGIWREFKAPDDDDEALYRTELPSETGLSVGGLTMELALARWVTLCKDFHADFHDDEHFDARCKARREAEFEGEKARAKVVLLEIMNIMPGLFISPLQDAQWNTFQDVLRSIHGATAFESSLPPLEQVVPDCLPRITHACTDLEDWSLYVISDIYMTSHKTLRSADVALRSFLNVHTGADKKVGIFLAKDWWVAQRAFSEMVQEPAA